MALMCLARTCQIWKWHQFTLTDGSSPVKNASSDIVWNWVNSSCSHVAEKDVTILSIFKCFSLIADTYALASGLRAWKPLTNEGFFKFANFDFFLCHVLCMHHHANSSPPQRHLSILHPLMSLYHCKLPVPCIANSWSLINIQQLEQMTWFRVAWVLVRLLGLPQDKILTALSRGLSFAFEHILTSQRWVQRGPLKLWDLFDPTCTYLF